MKRTNDRSEPADAQRLSEFGDALVNGLAPTPRSDVEATLLRVQDALGRDQRASASPNATLKQRIWEEFMTPTLTHGDPRTHVKTRPFHGHGLRRPSVPPSVTRVVYRWQAFISLALVFIVLVSLAGIVMQQQGGPSRGHHQPQMVSASPTMNDVAPLPQVPQQCVANGAVTSNAELKTRSISDWPTPQYTSVQTVSYEQGLAVQKTFLAYTRCEWNAVHSATPPATPEPPVLAEPTLLTYFSDRLRYDRLYSELSPSQQQQLHAYRCIPRIDKLLASFPLPVNQPLDRAKLDGNDASASFVPIFSPSDVYRLADGRYAAIVGTISTAALTDPNAVTAMDTLQFIAFTQVNGRYYIDEIFTLVAPNMDQITLNGRNGSLATNCP